MENLRITLAAGETKVFVKAGRYFEIIDSTAAVTLAFYDSNGSQCDDATNVLSGFFFSESYAQFDIYSATAQTVEIFLSSSAAGSKRQPGIVRVVDGERDKVISGVCFRGAPGNSGNAPVCQLFNPAGSGKNVFVQAVRAGALNADSWGIRTTTTPHTTSQGQGRNLDVTGADSAAQMRVDVNPTPANQRFLASGYIAASSDTVVIFPRPVIVRPGYGIDFYVGAAANTIRTNFEWEEWPL
ncbi:hypothetical protein LNV08_22045 [Paucibacter sp. TC2R-5]|uniref:hypothetical protein n=1 Tax=Paucibacter sp. TC2R-5 TaxID=2893555 RepID=UPI0021E505B9|nr:hypothetical protein [Paucibacter sp. TC2R-5]MCV2361656.1 hypothetical protein [Paucibacter sp. TC2R-5]